MKTSLVKGFGFGLTSGVITTLGIIVGLDSSTHSRTVVLGGVLIIAIADALSDALGMHVSQESDPKNTGRQVWESTLMTLAAKFAFAMTFAVPFLILPLNSAVLACIAWGLLLISWFSYYIAKRTGQRPAYVISEHIIIAALVIIATRLIGLWIAGLGWV